ncbi:MAG: aspartate-semialdehyde dehydrogenase [Verrucomicrobiota bacterium]
MSKDSFHVAVVGATGAVGVEMLQCLAQRGFPVGKLTALASARSAGKSLDFGDEKVTVEELTTDSFAGVDIALFSAGSSLSREFGPHAVEAGATIIDNSSAFRMDDSVPLVIPEVNPQAAKDHKGIIANPNCTTIVTLMGLYPLHKEFGVKRIVASSYQAVSGSGAQGIAELKEQVDLLAKGEHQVHPNIYPRQIAFNVIPIVETITENGYTKEEMKMQDEGRKIMDHADFQASTTCVRVPVYRSHAVAVAGEFEKTITVDYAREVLEAAPGVDVMDDREHALFPTPLDSTNKDDCLVGRLRSDLVFENGLSFFIVGDQVRKGAALNAVQIAELLVS